MKGDLKNITPQHLLDKENLFKGIVRPFELGGAL
jgi:hypothetical protein